MGLGRMEELVERRRVELPGALKQSPSVRVRTEEVERSLEVAGRRRGEVVREGLHWEEQLGEGQW